MSALSAIPAFSPELNVPSFAQPDASEQRAQQQSEVRVEQAYQYREKQSLQLELVTQEGDYVRVDIRSDFYQSQQLQASNDGLSLQQSQQENVLQRYIVQGDLNAEEKAALDQLLEKSADLAANFFSGNVDEAFSQAVQLGFDSRQIAGFSLQVSQQQQLQTYTAVEQLGPPQPQKLANEQVQQLGQFVQDLEGVVQQAQAFSNPLHTLTQLLDQLGVQPRNASDIFDQLIESLVA